ncbi:YtxH domain-containing protein [Lactobacillus psittaci]|uniref:Tropomyosin n=1 Tax=Lactobacillus psittaci DSM 15354 TaxID=1122152 RepID=A0A0R1RY50_9LACO|nr:YtxH domain-containing protein [Lactobacillus psittaci]KRL61895.1 hypothetical protein FC23_GL000444 [Lactobacillus psittaci DSM 15354]
MKAFGFGLLIGAAVGVAASLLPTDENDRRLRDDVKDYLDGTASDANDFSNSLARVKENLAALQAASPIAQDAIDEIKSKTSNFQSSLSNQVAELKSETEKFKNEAVKINRQFQNE